MSNIYTGTLPPVVDPDADKWVDLSGKQVSQYVPPILFEAFLESEMGQEWKVILDDLKSDLLEVVDNWKYCMKRAGSAQLTRVEEAKRKAADAPIVEHVREYCEQKGLKFEGGEDPDIYLWGLTAKSLFTHLQDVENKIMDVTRDAKLFITKYTTIVDAATKALGSSWKHKIE
ncbi:MAG: hypothetical protein LBE31_07740 [Deltaproteobacteria bacterium]|jgi:hypothetical protein|nr:hypothetical protein [Deltaproteobacteria bacterium]